MILNALPDLSEVRPLLKAYAHNNGEHPTPLIDALRLGYNHIEVDVCLIDKQLYVYHDHPKKQDSNRTLANLYLDPLFKLQEHNHGFIYPQHKAPLILMIDIKTDGAATYTKLKEVLTPYQSMLSHWENNVESTKAVNVIISGNRPIQLVAQDNLRYVQVDGRLKDLPQHYPSILMPTISDNSLRVFGFLALFPILLGKRSMKKLQALSEEAHRQNKTLRLWNTPESESLWDQLIASGVDLVNTDDLERLSRYFLNV